MDPKQARKIAYHHLGADSLDNGASAYGSFDFVWSAIAVHCARRIPSLHLPPFPGSSDAS